MKIAALLACVALSAAPGPAKEYRIAVVGLVHSHVWGHLGKMIKGEPAKLVGVAETIPELVAEAKKRGVYTNLFYSDYMQMLDKTKPDIVWAFVENNRHLEIARACAARKIHVVFEKPLASTYRDAAAIRDLARKSGIQVMTNYQMAWWPSNYAAKAQVDAGALGKVWRLRGVVGHGGPGGPTGLNKYFFAWLTDPVKNGAGALVDFGCYNALWSLWYLGKPESVYAQVLHLRPETFPKVEDSSTLLLKYNNAVGLFEGSWDLPRSFQDLEVFGLAGSVYVTRDRVELRQRRQSADVPLPQLAPERSEPIAFLINALETGKPVQGLTALDLNVDVVEILDAARESIRTSVPVKLKK
ncbi:MAG: Gfo/Idh/MocA family oxidoreductase [Acidobacteria bacterium]|nr:Gfo/Idh/MocA family oxidoreductase [Acidobacteriota bacterium]